MDEKIFNLVREEEQRQRDGLELIPSENYASRDVIAALGSVLTNKYSEGYPSFDGLDGEKIRAMSDADFAALAVSAADEV